MREKIRDFLLKKAYEKMMKKRKRILKKVEKFKLNRRIEVNFDLGYRMFQIEIDKIAIIRENSIEFYYDDVLSSTIKMCLKIQKCLGGR